MCDCGCLCGACEEDGCACECHLADWVPNAVVMEVMQNNGYALSPEATRQRMFQWILEQDAPVEIMLECVGLQTKYETMRARPARVAKKRPASNPSKPPKKSPPKKKKPCTEDV